MLSSAEILKFLKENKHYFKTHFNCTEIGLFGSFARNEQSEKSDIDILVSFDPDTPDLYHKEQQLKKYLEANFNRSVDICAKKWIRPVFKPLVLKEAMYA
ncbi:MAG: nucleotidyltransferase domain-containing protein [Bacteroidales bacterium]|nr:nucleotidyltransferase domain-containing protein [Bacteroidales bacterium]